MDPAQRDAYIDAYLDWLHDEAGSVGKASSPVKGEFLGDLVKIFITGKKKPDPTLIQRLQEIFTIAFYLIGDASGDDPLTRLKRAMNRRTKLLNIWRASMGLEDLKPTELPEAAPAAEENKEEVIKLDD
jgi:hypothetical protein